MVNPSNAKLNPICHLLALLEVHHILYISRIRVKELPEVVKQHIAKYRLCSRVFYLLKTLKHVTVHAGVSFHTYTRNEIEVSCKII